MALPHGAVEWSAVYDCGISSSNSFEIRPVNIYSSPRLPGLKVVYYVASGMYVCVLVKSLFCNLFLSSVFSCSAIILLK